MYFYFQRLKISKIECLSFNFAKGDFKRKAQAFCAQSSQIKFKIMNKINIINNRMVGVQYENV